MSTPAAAVRDVARTRRVDVHTHLVPRRFRDDVEARRGRYGISFERGEAGGSVLVTPHYRGPASGEYEDVGMRLEAMAASQTGLEVLALPAAVMVHGSSAERGLELARLANDALAEICQAHPQAFTAFGIVPLEDGPSASGELERVRRDLGLPGVMMATHVNGGPLDTPELEPLYAAAEATDAVLFVHPTGPVVAAERLARHGLANAVGFPTEIALAALELALGGVLDRHPRLRVLLAHCGGALFWIAPRVDRAWRAGWIAGHRPPSEALGRFWYDTVAHDPEALRWALRVVGTARLLYGTDHPSPMGDPGGAATLVVLAELAERERHAVLAGNAAHLLGLTTSID